MSWILMLDAPEERINIKRILIFSQQSLNDQQRKVCWSWSWSRSWPVLFLRSRICWRKQNHSPVLPPVPLRMPASTQANTHSCLHFNDPVPLNCSRTQQLWVCKPFWERLTPPTPPLFSVYITRISSKRFSAYNVPSLWVYQLSKRVERGVWGSLLFFHQYIWHHL